jgi:DNA-binding transcriptional LysR family regulator
MTDIRKPDLNLLHALGILLEERNVSRAAERLHLTQPTVSGMLSRLRELFDDPLFIRTQHGLLPTPRAEALEPALRQLLADTAALVQVSGFDPKSSDVVVSLSVNDYMQSILILPLAQRLRRVAPLMKLGVRHLAVTGLLPMLARGEVDMAITIPEFTDPALHSRFLYREEYVAVVRKEHPIRSRRVSLQRFLAYDHVLVSPSDGAFEGPADVALKRLGRQRRVALSVPSFFILADVLQIDNLIALMPERLFLSQSTKLRRIDIPIEVPGFDVVVAWHSRTHHELAHRWLRDELSTLGAALDRKQA